MPFTRPCPKNGTEDKIMDYCLGLLRNKNFTAAHQRIKFYNRGSQDHYNRTGHSHHTLPESSDYNTVPVSPSLLGSGIIGMVVIISCVIIILSKLYWDSQGRAQQSRCCQEFEDSQDSVESSYLSRGAHNACNPGEEANAMVLRELYTDSPPCYEECTGPGATQRYLPTDAPPSYSLNTNPGGYQQGQSGPRPISMDAPPTYEAVCEIYPPSGWLSLPGPEPGPQSPLGSPERVV